MRDISIRSGFRSALLVSVDTAVVLVLFAMECGRSLWSFVPGEAALSALTLSMLLVLPYFLPSAAGRAGLGSWIAWRSGTAAVGFVAGALLAAASGPVPFQFMPMTLLIIAAMISCYLQFYGLMKLRLVK